MVAFWALDYNMMQWCWFQSYSVMQYCSALNNKDIRCTVIHFTVFHFAPSPKDMKLPKRSGSHFFQCLSLSLLLSLKVQLCPWMMFKQCCMKERFCVLLTEDLEQKDGDAQWSTVRHMLSIKMPAINTRYTAPGQQDGNPLGWGGSTEDARRMEEREAHGRYWPWRLSLREKISGRKPLWLESMYYKKSQSQRI